MNRINYWDLIKEKTIDEICPLGNKRNNYTNSVFAEKQQTESRDRPSETTVNP